LAATAAVSALLAAGSARAANGAYAVDAADISEVGSCRSRAGFRPRQHRFFGSGQSVLRREHLQAGGIEPADGEGAQRRRLEHHGRAEGEVEYRSHRIGKLGMAFYAGGSFDALTGGNLTTFAVVPVTFRLSEVMRINAIAGWLWNRTVDRHYLTYGVGFDWKFTETLQWTIEAFARPAPPIIRAWCGPDFKTGVR